MKTLSMLLTMMALAVTPECSLTQEPTGASSNLPSEEAQTPAKAPPAPSVPTPPTPAATQKVAQEAPAPNIENTAEAAEPSPRRDLVPWNEYRGPYFTIRAGVAFLYDFAAFAQDKESKEQIAMLPGEKLRDFRFIMGGKLPTFKRPVTWCAGVMYDGPTHSWVLRKTGIMIGVPEILSYFFIGRDKEGFSLNKVMVGYDGWTMERSTMSDATIPLLAEGFRWLAYSKRHGFVWNLGYFNDVSSKGQSFSSYSSTTRVAPGAFGGGGHADSYGGNFRWGKPVDGQLRLRSRPEAYIAPFFIDPGTFAASSSNSQDLQMRRSSSKLAHRFLGSRPCSSACP